MLGYWQNKGYDLTDPAKVATEASKAYLEAQKFVGVPTNQLLRLPKDANDEAGWSQVYQRLGAPKDAKEYDFNGIKYSGEDLDPAFADTMRQALANSHVPKDKAAPIVSAVVKYFEGIESAEATDNQAKLETERAALVKSWGPQAEFNRLTAMQGAKRLGVTPEDVALMEKQLGYSRVMEIFRRVGAGTTEDTFVEGRQGSGAPATREAAGARLAELESDPAWRERFLRGDLSAKKEWQALIEQEFGMSEAEAAA